MTPLVVRVTSPDDVAAAALDARSFARDAGLGVEEQMRIATVAAELASNIAKYADHGRIRLSWRLVDGIGCLDVEANDRGPGIASVDVAMQDHISSGGTLGLGLPGVRRLVDEFEISSTEGHGTTVRTRRWAGRR